MSDVGDLAEKREMSMEEIGEAMAEQKRRLQETEDDDYFDNDAGLDYDEAAHEEAAEAAAEAAAVAAAAAAA